jgi:PAS domain S-box-containing protein
MSSPPSAKDAWSTAQLLQLVMDNIPQHIFWKDRELRYLGCNRNFAKAAGFDRPEDLIGKCDFDLPWRHEESEFFRSVDRRVMESGKAEYHIIEPQLQADGRQAWLDTNKVPLCDENGEVVGILGTYEDITERKLAEEALQHAQKLEAIGQLAGGIAHDFNNLLGGIIGAADLIRGRLTESAEIRALAHEILKTSERAAELTSKLLAFSRRGRMQNEIIDLSEAVDNVTTLLRRSIDRRITLVVEHGALVSTVRGDASELESALLNLGLNARDAMPRGGRLRITTENVEHTPEFCEASTFQLAAGTYVRVRVEDSGTGIAPEIRARIFEPFFTTKPRGEGTGLGLAAVYGAVCSHGGAVTVLDGPEGKGTVFQLDVPVVAAPTSSRDVSISGSVPKGLRVLLIDDEPVIRSSASRLLAELGAVVHVAEDGDQGVAFFAQHRDELDLVILDVIMPGCSGRECYRLLKALRPDIRIIMSSGFTRDELIEDITEDGAAAVLKKPYGREGLTRALLRALAAR